VRACAAHTVRLRNLLTVGLALALYATAAFGADALVLGQDVPVRQAPNISARIVARAKPGEMLEVIGRKPGKGQSLYLDERGEVWIRVRVKDDLAGFVQTNQVSVAREEYKAPKKKAVLIVNLRATVDGDVSRELWLVQGDWQHTRRLGNIEGRPIWDDDGEWFLIQVDSDLPVRDQLMERTVERIEKHSADGRTRTVLAAGSYPVVSHARQEVYFYRDVDEHGDPVPPGLFAVSLHGGPPRPIYLLPERFRFWKEDGDFFVQAPPPALQPGHRVTLFAFDRSGGRFRFSVALDGLFVEQRRD
jgi:hypothetical protein